MDRLRHHGPGRLHHHPRPVDRQRRVPGDPARLHRQPRRRVVGGHRLQHLLRVPARGRRHVGRPARAQAPVPRRRRHLRHGLAAVRARPHPPAARRRPRDPGHRRRRDHARLPRPPARCVPAGAAHADRRRVGRHRRARRGQRTEPRRAADQRDGLAGGVLGEPADLRRPAPGGPGLPRGDAARRSLRPARPRGSRDDHRVPRHAGTRHLAVGGVGMGGRPHHRLPGHRGARDPGLPRPPAPPPGAGARPRVVPQPHLLGRECGRARVLRRLRGARPQQRALPPPGVGLHGAARRPAQRARAGHRGRVGALRGQGRRTTWLPAARRRGACAGRRWHARLRGAPRRPTHAVAVRAHRRGGGRRHRRLHPGQRRRRREPPAPAPAVGGRRRQQHRPPGGLGAGRRRAGGRARHAPRPRPARHRPPPRLRHRRGGDAPRRHHLRRPPRPHQHPHHPHHPSFWSRKVGTLPSFATRTQG